MNVAKSQVLLILLSMLYAWAVEAKVTVVTLSNGQPISLQGAVVSFKSVAAEKRPTARFHNVSMEQINRQFRPFILPISVNTPVLFPNLDDTAHHVYSFSKFRKFELPLYKGVLPKPIIFTDAGVVPLGCNIHDWMIGYIVVVDSPYFTQLEGGIGVIDAIPPGRYEVSIWHPALDRRETLRELLDVAGDSTTMKFDLKFPLLAAAQPQPPAQRADERLDY